MALTGDSFCSSAMNAFVLALKNAGTFAITNGAGALLEILGKLCISVANTGICYLILEYNPEFEELDSPVAPLTLCFILSFMLARVFMDVYGTTSLTVLQCLYVDVDLQGQKGEDKFDNPHRPPEMDSIVAMLRVQ
jgi:solute carrier family 44 (choline transporter-like protein), member 2/4/5